MARTVAALFVAENGTYFGLPDVDPWDETRDARFYAGPHPVVAHPPCARWCRFAPGLQTRFGIQIGNDGGCFEAALAAVRQFGGVLEHPASSIAWQRFGLPRPHRGGLWQRGLCGGWACYVEQQRYGHIVKKATWLYAFGFQDGPPPLDWGFRHDRDSVNPIRWPSGEKKLAGDMRPCLSKADAIKTPEAFRDALLAIARASSAAAAASCSRAAPA